MANDSIDTSNTAVSTLTVLGSDPTAGTDAQDQALASTDDWLNG